MAGDRVTRTLLSWGGDAQEWRVNINVVAAPGNDDPKIGLGVTAELSG
jgi:hypothetical protein